MMELHAFLLKLRAWMALWLGLLLAWPAVAQFRVEVTGRFKNAVFKYHF